MLNRDYRPTNDDFFRIGCPPGTSKLTRHEANIGRTHRERKKNAARITRRAERSALAARGKSK